MMKRYSLAAVMMILVLTALGAEPLVLTVNEAVDLGLANNYNLKVQENSLAGKIRARRDAWNVFIPDVGASLTLSRKNEAQAMGGTAILGTNIGIMDATTADGIYEKLSIQSYETELSPWTAVGSLSAQLVLSPAIGNGIKALDLDYQNSLLSLEASENTTEQGIKRNFYSLLLLEEQIEVLKRNIETTRNRLTSMEAMYRNGYITELDLLKTRAGLSSLGPALLGLQNGYEQLLMVFRMDLGLDLDQELRLEGKVEVSPEALDADDLVKRFLPGRTDIQQLLVNQKMLENVKALNFNQGRLPALVLGWTYSPYQADPFDPDRWGEDGFSGDNGSLSITLSVPLDDWLPRSGTANKIKEAQDNIDRLGYQKELAFLAAEMEIRNLVMSLNTSREKLTVLTESVEINEQSLRMSRESYDNGGIALLDLETAENDLLQAEIDLLSEKFTYISSLLDLEKALNTRLAR